MRFTAILAFIAAATVVSASTNAERLARGLPPRAPGKRATPPLRARHSTPSHTASSWGCSTGTQHCCSSVQRAHSGDSCDAVLKKYGMLDNVSPGTGVGMNCSPISVLGAAGNQCSQQAACCDGMQQHGLINLGCNPVNVGV